MVIGKPNEVVMMKDDGPFRQIHAFVQIYFWILDHEGASV